VRFFIVVAGPVVPGEGPERELSLKTPQEGTARGAGAGD